MLRPVCLAVREHYLEKRTTASVAVDATARAARRMTRSVLDCSHADAVGEKKN